MAKIGIFWIHNDTVIGKAVEINAGEEYVPGIVDSPDDHVTLWEKTPGFLTPYPALIGMEYQTVPRGRVLYNRTEKKTVVYMDRCLFSGDLQAKISRFFRLKETETVWRSDPHYTIDPETISRLFEEGW
jgi:hypothetical protein